MTYFKLTRQTLQTYMGFRWTRGKWAPTLSGAGPLCACGWYHVYDSPLLAALFNAAHAGIKNPRLFEASADGRMRTLDDNGMKRGVRRLRLDKEVTLPELTRDQLVRFAIYCARRIYDAGAWMLWSSAWLDGTDRRETTAESVRLPAAGHPDCAHSAACAALGVVHRENYAFHAAAAASYIVPLTIRAPGVNIWEVTMNRAIEDEKKFQEEYTA